LTIRLLSFCASRAGTGGILWGRPQFPPRTSRTLWRVARALLQLAQPVAEGRSPPADSPLAPSAGGGGLIAAAEAIRADHPEGNE